MGISILALTLTGCFQEQIEDSCQAAADKAEASCERMIDEALDQFWQEIEKELKNTFKEVGCVPNGPGDLEYDCSNTFLCPE